MSSSKEIPEYNGWDLESNSFPPERVTASEQRLILLSHIVRTFGIGVALIINFIVFIPCFIFGILPILIKKRLGKISTSDYPNLTPAVPTSVPVYPKRIHLALAQFRYQLPSADISPLLLSADSDFNNIPGLGTDLRIRSAVPDYLPRLSPFPYEFPNPFGAVVDHLTPTIQHIKPGFMCKDCGGKDFQHCAVPQIIAKDTSEDEVLEMKKTVAVNSLEGTPIYGRGLTSSLMIPGGGCGEKGCNVLQRTKTWENLRHSMYSPPNSL